MRRAISNCLVIAALIIGSDANGKDRKHKSKDPYPVSFDGALITKVTVRDVHILELNSMRNVSLYGLNYPMPHYFCILAEADEHFSEYRAGDEMTVNGILEPDKRYIRNCQVSSWRTEGR